MKTLPSTIAVTAPSAPREPHPTRRFTAIAVSYFMGLFNDNFYKEAALFIAVRHGNTAIQAGAAALFTLCYMLGAAPGGWLADRFPKGRIIVVAKAIEVLAMIAGAFGIWYGNWWLALTMIGLMGAQSAVFSPSMNGSIPELYPPEKVHSANTAVRILSTTAILIGMALAGTLMDWRQPSWQGMEQGIFLVGLLVLVAASIGFVISFGAPRIPACAIDAPFPWKGPIESVREAVRIRRDPLLSVCVGANIFIWSLATVMTLLMINLGETQFSLPARQTAGMKIVFLIGVTLGGLLSNVVAKGPRFFRVLIPAYGCMAGLLVLVGILPFTLPFSAMRTAVPLLVALAGVAGGVILVPLESFIQIRPEANHKGRVIAAANFAVFAGMTLAAGLLFALNRYFQPTASLGILGVLTAAFAAWLNGRLQRALQTEKNKQAIIR